MDLRLPRLFGTTAATLAIGTVGLVLAPSNLPVVVYKLSLVTTGVLAGYLLDRAVFPYGRPDKVGPELQPAAHMRRAVLIAACVLGVCYGL